MSELIVVKDNVYADLMKRKSEHYGKTGKKVSVSSILEKVLGLKK